MAASSSTIKMDWLMKSYPSYLVNEGAIPFSGVTLRPLIPTEIVRGIHFLVKFVAGSASTTEPVASPLWAIRFALRLKPRYCPLRCLR